MAERRPKPYDRAEYNRALIANALTDPFNVTLLAAMLIAGFLLGLMPWLIPVAGGVYAIAAARTYFDEDAAAKVLERERERRRERLGSGRRRVRPEELAPPIRRLVEEGRVRQERIARAVERAELPYAEVTAEVDGFTEAMDATARRAQLLHEALADTPPDQVAQRLEAVRARQDPAQADLAEALETQLGTLERMERQLERFYGEMERTLVELETVRSQLVSLSASTESARQSELADEVRALRERMGTVADGMAAAFEPPR